MVVRWYLGSALATRRLQGSYVMLFSSFISFSRLFLPRSPFFYFSAYFLFFWSPAFSSPFLFSLLCFPLSPSFFIFFLLSEDQCTVHPAHLVSGLGSSIYLVYLVLPSWSRLSSTWMPHSRARRLSRPVEHSPPKSLANHASEAERARQVSTKSGSCGPGSRERCLPPSEPARCYCRSLDHLEPTL